MIMAQHDHHYLKHVMRLRTFDTFRLFNEQDGEFVVSIQEFYRASVKILVLLMIKEVIKDKDLTLALCIIKQDRLIEAITSAVQVGVTRIIPLISERTQYKKISWEKLRKCIIGSVQQSGRFKLPILEKELYLAEFCNNYHSAQIIFACELETQDNIILKINEIEDTPIILVGPEGGFSTHEVNIIKSMKNSTSVSLGHTILRSEVAVLSALSYVSMIRNR